MILNETGFNIDDFLHCRDVIKCCPYYREEDLSELKEVRSLYYTMADSDKIKLCLIETSVGFIRYTISVIRGDDNDIEIDQ